MAKLLLIPLSLILSAQLSWANMSGSASQASTQAAIGGAMNGAMAAMFFAKCSTQNYWACALGAMSAANAAMSFATSKDQASVASQLSCQEAGGDLCDQLGNIDSYVAGEDGSIGTGSSRFDPSNYSKFVSEVDKLAGKADIIKKQLASKGYTTNSDGSVTGPDGTTYASSDFASDSAMSAKGFTDDQIAQIKDSMLAKGIKEDLQRKGILDKLKLGYGSGGGGSRSRLNAATNKDYDPMSAFMQQMNAQKAAKRKRGISSAGLTKRINAHESIGVASDNIFKIVSRKYKDKQRKKEFLP